MAEVLVIMGIGGLLAGAIASSRGLGFGAYFIVGALFPLIGIILAAVAKAPRRPTPAPGQGWWPDPTGRFEHRYYDGRHWTSHVGRSGSQFEDAI